MPGGEYFRDKPGRRSLNVEMGISSVVLRKSHPQESGLGLYSCGDLTYLNSFTGILQLTDHSLDSIIVPHKDSNAITELRLMKRKEGCKILGVF